MVVVLRGWFLRVRWRQHRWRGREQSSPERTAEAKSADAAAVWRESFYRRESRDKSTDK